MIELPSRPHVLELHRDICLACGMTRQFIEDAPAAKPECDGKVQYREWLRGLTWSRTPVIPGLRA